MLYHTYHGLPRLHARIHYSGHLHDAIEFNSTELCLDRMTGDREKEKNSILPLRQRAHDSTKTIGEPVRLHIERSEKGTSGAKIIITR